MGSTDVGVGVGFVWDMVFLYFCIFKGDIPIYIQI